MSNSRISPLSEDDRAAMVAAAREAVAYRARLDDAAVKPDLRPSELALQFDPTLHDQGAGALAVIDDLIAIAAKDKQAQGRDQPDLKPDI